MMDKASLAGLAWHERVLSSEPIDGKSLGMARGSRKGFYRLAKGWSRPISHARSETVHPSVLERWDEDPKYRPPNLRGFLRSSGDPRAKEP